MAHVHWLGYEVGDGRQPYDRSTRDVCHIGQLSLHKLGYLIERGEREREREREAHEHISMYI